MGKGNIILYKSALYTQLLEAGTVKGFHKPAPAIAMHLGLQNQDSGQRTVLIADDDRALAEAIAATLSMKGIKTVVADDGDQALALAHTLA